jgi:hypothetical protein
MRWRCHREAECEFAAVEAVSLQQMRCGGEVPEITCLYICNIGAAFCVENGGRFCQQELAHPSLTLASVSFLQGCAANCEIERC